MGRRFKSFAKYDNGILEIRFFECPIKVEIPTKEKADKYLEEFKKEWQRRLDHL